MTDAPQMDPARVDAIDTMLRDVVQRDAARSRHATRRRLAWLTLPLLAGTAVIAAGVTAPKTAPITNGYEVACFARATYEGADGSVPGTFLSILTGEPGAAGEASPVEDVSVPAAAREACTTLWVDGSLDPSSAQGLVSPGESPSMGDVPDDLTVCVLPGGTAAVIPGGGDVCDRLNLPTPTTE